jgi:phage-related protein
MPPVQVVYYQEDEGTIPMVEWLNNLKSQPKHRAKCIKSIGLLKSSGHDLRRPYAAPLRDDIYELRVQYGYIHYRMLYFFHGNTAVVLTHGVTKEKEVPSVEIDRAIRLKQKYEDDPDSHSFLPES